METIKNKHAKLEALFLNKVKGLNWYYFQLDLNRATNLKAQQKRAIQSEIETVIKEDAEGKYFYTPKSGTSSEDMSQILQELLSYTRQNPQAPRRILKRIFDANEPVVLNNSGAHEGILGKSNRADNRKRLKKFKKKIRSKKFQNRKDTAIIMAEGDSWFQFPAVRPLGDPVKDIIDNLDKNDNYAIYSVAEGGDWLSNMIKTAEYIEELDRLAVDALLLSGGGNDMLGDHRLAQMVHKKGEEIDLNNPDDRTKALLEIRLNGKQAKSFDAEKYKRGIAFLNDNFFNFINVTMSQYFLLISELMAIPRYKDLKFITQGYDFAIPSYKRRGFIVSRQRAINSFMDTGKWLYDPLTRKRITDPEDQQAILYAMIYEFNEMLIQLACYEKFTNLFHIDCRGTGEDFKDWFDEIHLNSKKYKEVANAYMECVDDQILNKRNANKKVYKVRQDLHYSSLYDENGNPVESSVKPFKIITKKAS